MDTIRSSSLSLSMPDVIRKKEEAGGIFSGKSFAERLQGAVKEVNGLQKESDTASEKVILGELDVHEGMMALQKAELSMRLLLQVRSKSLEAYKEIMHMQF